MSIFNVPSAPGPDVADGARQIRQILLRLVNQTDNGLSRIREIVNTHTRTALATELGADAPALLTVYNNLKDMLEDASVGRTIDDLPS